VRAILVLVLMAVGGDWPQFRGPKRDGVSTETNLLKRWPQGGPKLIWRAKGIGEGFATVSVSDGMIYTAGNIAAETVVTALDLSGGVKWQTSNGKSYKQGRLSGSRGTPTVVAARLYHESPHGDVACLDAKSGKTIWSLNIFQTFGGRQITWAVSESLLVDGGKVICCPGGPDAGMVALDAKTGRTVWICKALGDKPAYASPIVFDFAGVRQIVTMTFSAAVGVHAETGHLLWRFEHGNPRGTNVPTPIHRDGAAGVRDAVRVPRRWQAAGADADVIRRRHASAAPVRARARPTLRRERRHPVHRRQGQDVRASADPQEADEGFPPPAEDAGPFARSLPRMANRLQRRQTGRQRFRPARRPPGRGRPARRGRPTVQPKTHLGPEKPPRNQPRRRQPVHQPTVSQRLEPVAPPPSN
jgi:hypothetical protein